ncbi:uncharacterized protein LOC141911420 [Tubulanus polymorphus]|uniref:uncharacterized protein LOC141911420 n=1 Tax=Tubulanus polymorphus TaxID=672921 RepID=UPI003DA6A974
MKGVIFCLLLVPMSGLVMGYDRFELRARDEVGGDVLEEVALDRRYADPLPAVPDKPEFADIEIHDEDFDRSVSRRKRSLRLKRSSQQIRGSSDSSFQRDERGVDKRKMEDAKTLSHLNRVRDAAEQKAQWQ